MEKESVDTPKQSATEKGTKTSQHAKRYFIIGVMLAFFNYGLYTILANIIIRNNDLIWLSTLIATAFTTILAYVLHSKITWKERDVTKTAIYKFFIWNALLTFLISPGLAQFFSVFNPLYELAFNILNTIHINFTYEFVLTTGVFVLSNIIIMIINFLFYDRFVFGKKM